MPANKVIARTTIIPAVTMYDMVTAGRPKDVNRIDNNPRHTKSMPRVTKAHTSFLWTYRYTASFFIVEGVLNPVIPFRSSVPFLALIPTDKINAPTAINRPPNIAVSMASRSILLHHHRIGSLLH